MIGFYLALRFSSVSDACVIAAAPGASVRCLSEDAVLIWDSNSRTETLVRSMTFQSHAVDFAFLTATPSQPVIREVDQDIFLRAHTLTKPNETLNVQTKIRWSWFFHKPMTSVTPKEKIPSFSSGTISRVENTVFAPSEAKSIESWFHENGYAYTLPLRRWVAATIEKNGFITVSRIEKPKSAMNESRIRNRSMQFSFQSVQPVYPYREPVPQGAVGAGRSLRLYMLSHEQLHGSLEGDPWSGKTAYSKKQGDLQSQMGSFFTYEEDIPKVGWLTLFSDFRAGRSQKDDLRFVPVHRPKTISRKAETVDEIKWLIIPLDIIAAFVLAVFAFMTWRRRIR